MSRKTKKRSHSKPKSASTTTTLDPGRQTERDLRAKVGDLEKSVRTYQVLLNKSDPLKGLDTDARKLIDRLTNTLIALQEAGAAIRSSPLEAQMRFRRPDSTGDEGAATRWARDLEKRIHRKLNPLLNEYDMRVEGRWKPRPRSEKVWCRNSTCEAKNKRVDRYVGPGNAIEMVTCQKCSGRLTAA